MLLTVLAFSVPFGQPARTLVNYSGEKGDRRNGVIALAGPAVSLSLAIVFLVLLAYFGSLTELWKSGFTMCMLACVYSLMPFEPMEGAKVLKWNKVAWGVAFLPALAFYLFMLIFVFTA
jgi:Zn-dependent protease